MEKTKPFSSFEREPKQRETFSFVEGGESKKILADSIFKTCPQINSAVREKLGLTGDSVEKFDGALIDVPEQLEGRGAGMTTEIQLSHEEKSCIIQAIVVEIEAPNQEFVKPDARKKVKKLSLILI